jgi:PAS domain S-box-containing protein
MDLDDRSARLVVDLVDGLGVGLLVSETGRILDANGSLCAMIGRTLDELRDVGDPIVLLPVDERRKEAELHSAALTGGSGMARVQSALVDAHGERVPVDAMTAFEVAEDGSLKVLAAVLDRSEVQRSQLLLERYEALVDRLPIGILTWDANGVEDPRQLRLHAANTPALNRLGMGPETIGRTLGELFPAADPGRIARLLAMRGTDRMEYFGEITYGDERTQPALYRARALALPDGLVATVFEDITRERAEERERHRLLRRLVDTSDVERRHLAMAVHDDSVQQLAAASVLVAGLRRHPDSPQRDQRLATIEEALRGAMASLRRLVFDLSPPELVESGLEAAVRSAGDYVFEDQEIDVNIDVSLVHEPPDVVQTAAYRIVAEALTNVRKHAQAASVTVAVAGTDDELDVIVADDGIGLGRGASEPGHMGLRSMRERAAALGGRCTIASGPTGHGTIVSAILPFEGVPAPVAKPPEPADLITSRGEVDSLRLEFASLSISAAEARRRATAARARLRDAMAMVRALFDPGLTETGVAQMSVRLIADAMPDGCAVARPSRDGTRLERVASWHPDPRQLDYLNCHLFVDRPIGAGHAGTVLRSQVPVLIDRSTRSFLSDDGPALPAGPYQVRSMILAPLTNGPAVEGVLTAVRDRTGGVFDDDDVEFLSGLASQLAMALSLARGR